MMTARFWPYPIRHPFPSLHFLCEAWWTCYSSGRHTWRRRSDAMLAVGQPISVIPRTAREQLDLVTASEPRWPDPVPDLLGVSCRIGRVSVWLPIEDQGGLLHRFSLLALLPRQDLPDAPPFILLGMQFLLERQALLEADCSAGLVTAATCRLILP